MTRFQQITPGASRRPESPQDPLNADIQAKIDAALNQAQAMGIISNSREAARQFVEVEFEQTVGE